MSDVDLQRLLHLLEDDEKYHRECQVTDEMSARFVQVYGEQPDNHSFSDIIHTYIDRVSSIIKKRKEKSHVYDQQSTDSLTCANDADN